MKKLMFAMAIAATVGFAQADTEIGTTTTFDSLTAETAFDTDTDQQWTNNADTEGPVDATVKAYESVGDHGANYLQLDGVQNLAKKIGTAGTAIGDGLYIDTMVKFTASEDAPTPGDEDKLVVWLKETPGENDNPSTYTLMVTAGYIDTDHEELSTKSYETTASVQPDTWYNLKVKAIGNVDAQEATDGTPGFVVFIDGTAVVTEECPADTPEFFGETKYVDGDNDSYAIFPSMVGAGENNWNTITQLAFSGSGSIDTVGAFEGDCDPGDEPTTYAVTYSSIENVTVVTDPADTTALAAGATVAFTVTPASTHEYATVPTGWEAGENGAITMTYTVVAGQNVVTIPEPTAKSVEPMDWPTGDDLDKVAGTTAAATFGISGALANVDAKVFATWASGNGGIAYADKGTVTINEKCFLLNIANSSSAADIEAAEAVAKEAIKITAISFDANGDVVLTYPATYGNGKIVVEGSVQLPAEWHDKVDADKFFRTKLVLDEIAAASGE